MIVKVQVSFSALNGRRVLAHDEGKTFRWEGPLDPDTEVLLAGRTLAFFHARIDEQKRIALQSEAGWQTW